MKVFKSIIYWLMATVLVISMICLFIGISRLIIQSLATHALDAKKLLWLIASIPLLISVVVIQTLTRPMD